MYMRSLMCGFLGCLRESWECSLLLIGLWSYSIQSPFRCFPLYYCPFLLTQFWVNYSALFELLGVRIVNYREGNMDFFIISLFFFCVNFLSECCFSFSFSDTLICHGITMGLIYFSTGKGENCVVLGYYITRFILLSVFPGLWGVVPNGSECLT